jgi:capsular polysaccharide transport system permease protein
MSLDDHSQKGLQALSPLERARLVSQALADAARRARFSTRSRRRLSHGGFQARHGQGAFRWAGIIGFWAIVVLPSALAGIYFGLIASDQYVTEFKFTVAGAEAPPLDGLGSLTGIPAMSVIQDTQIVLNHLATRAAVEAIDAKAGIRGKFSNPDIDWLVRFDARKPIEKLVRYWNSMIDTAIKMPAGIVDVKIRAFTPQDSLAISRAALDISEALINDLNDRMHRDAVASADSEVERASQRLTKARRSLETARNQEGLLDAGKAAEGVGQLVTESRSTLLKLQQEYNAQLKVVSATAPQMQALKNRIAGTQQQIGQLEAQVTRSGTTDLAEPTLSRLMTRFSELDLERQIAERLYAGAISSLEIARMNAERKKMYLNTFVQPKLPEEALYPRRGLSVLLTLLAGLAVWAGLGGLIGLIRNNMA